MSSDRDHLGVILVLVACLLIVAIAKMPAKPSMPDLCRCGVACECADQPKE